MLLRPGLSVFGRLYRFVREGGWDVWRRLTPLELEEVKVFQGLVFLSGVDLSAARAPLALGGDSSDLSYAVTVARALPEELLPLGRHLRFQPEEAVTDEKLTPYKAWGGGTQDLAPQFAEWAAAASTLGWRREGMTSSEARAQKKEARALREVTGVVPRLPGNFVQVDRWHVVFQGPWEYDADINEKEARVILMAVRRAARSWRLHGRRILGCSDNLSALLSFERGRSSGHTLRMLCCRVAAYFVSTEMQWPLRYVESERNSADHASRVGNRNEEVYIDRDVQRAVNGLFDLEHERHGPADGERPSGTPSSARPRRAASMADRAPRRRKDRSFLVLFAGTGRLSAAMKECRASCGASIDVWGRHHDICDARVRRGITGWISSGRVAHVHFGAPCWLWPVQALGRASSRPRGA